MRRTLEGARVVTADGGLLDVGEDFGGGDGDRGLGLARSEVAGDVLSGDVGVVGGLPFEGGGEGVGAGLGIGVLARVGVVIIGTGLPRSGVGRADRGWGAIAGVEGDVGRGGGDRRVVVGVDVCGGGVDRWGCGPDPGGDVDDVWGASGWRGVEGGWWEWLVVEGLGGICGGDDVEVGDGVACWRVVDAPVGLDAFAGGEAETLEVFNCCYPKEIHG